jgi:hypothetical protein
VVLLVTDGAIVGVVFFLAMTFLLIRLFRAIERMARSIRTSLAASSNA